MKLAIFSDSHGNPHKMLDAIAQTQPNAVIHLGDGERDIARIREQFPGLPLHAVCGNCDFQSALPATEFFNVRGVKIFITHGHLYGVKKTRATFIDEAIRRGANVAMYGHTHCAKLMTTGTFTLLNPGSCGASAVPSYAELTIGPGGKTYVQIIRL